MESLGIKQSPRVKKTQFLRKTNAEKAMRWFALLGFSSWISEQLNNVPVLPAERRKVRCRFTTTRCGNAQQHLHRAACTQSPKPVSAFPCPPCGRLPSLMSYTYFSHTGHIIFNLMAWAKRCRGDVQRPDGADAESRKERLWEHTGS